MTKIGTYIKYDDVAPGARKNFTPLSADKAPFVDLAELQEQPPTILNYANPCELYSVILDGTAKPLPDNEKSVYIGYWSEQISKNDGRFTNPIILSFSSDKKYSSSGISIMFGNGLDIYATDLTIKWFSTVDGQRSEISEKNFYPDSSEYFCQNKVEAYDEIEIIVRSINAPGRRLIINSVEHGGENILIEAKNIKNVVVTQEIDPVSAQISINTCDATLVVEDGEKYSFQQNQKIKVFHNEKSRGVFFAKDIRRTGEKTWNIKAEDYISLMEESQFEGGIYKDASAFSLLFDIFNAANVPFVVDDSVEDVSLTGYIPYTNCRVALMQVCFAMGTVATTADENAVRIIQLNDYTAVEVPANRIRQGQSFEYGKNITSVELTYHRYVEDYYGVDYTTIYEQKEEDDIGKEIHLTFTEPLHHFLITNGFISKKHENHVVFVPYEGCVLKAKKYAHIEQTKTKTNPSVLANDAKNTISIKDATLVSKSNVDKILDRCYNYYVMRTTTKMDVIENASVVHDGNGNKSIQLDDSFRVGERINFATSYLGTMSGIVLEKSFSLSSPSVLSKTSVRS